MTLPEPSSNRLHRRRLLQALCALPAAFAGGAHSTARAQASTTPHVVDPAYLHQLLETGGTAVRIIDVSPLRTYRSSHIPGAIHEFWEDTVDREYPHFGAVTTQGEDQRLRIDFVRELAIDPNTYVVAYDDSSGYRAARIVWYLRFLGFERVSLLDGGLQAWTDAGLPAESGVNTVDAADSATVAPREGYYVVTQQLLDRIASDQPPVIVDTRTGDERSDDLDGSIPTGAIPDSIYLPWTAMVNTESGTLRERAELESDLLQAGLTPEQSVIVYALFGVDAGLPWLVLKHLGFPTVETYDRGWVEWASRDDLPRDPL